jgi:hypothetical protein
MLICGGKIQAILLEQLDTDFNLILLGIHFAGMEHNLVQGRLNVAKQSPSGAMKIMTSYTRENVLMVTH